MKRKYFTYISFIVLVMALMLGCKKFIAIDAPITTTSDKNAYRTNEAAIAVLTGLYTQLSNDNANMEGINTMTLHPALSSDELSLVNNDVSTQILGFYTNNLQSTLISDDFFQKSYKSIYTSNAAIEGLNSTNTLTTTIKNQLLGEAYFYRAFCYFNLVGQYGGVPLVTSTDYKQTSSLPKAKPDELYALMKEDLRTAQNLLLPDYLGGQFLGVTTDRVRPNKFAATALLARIFLYTKDYTNAEIEATKIIDNRSIYDTVPLRSVFLKNSKETIWAIQPTGTQTNSNTGEGKLFIIPTSGFGGSRVYVLNERLRKSFQIGDKRYSAWVDSIRLQDVLYYYPAKYKIGQENVGSEEYPIILRLAEQYLIRAEARIQNNNITDGIEDLNVLRMRSTNPLLPVSERLAQLPADLSKEDAMSAVLHERRVELFVEWGHRWLDLRRTGIIDAIMSKETALKGGTWDSRWALYPFPLQQTIVNSNLIQNPGY